jgi:hypothetical protein
MPEKNPLKEGDELFGNEVNPDYQDLGINKYFSGRMPNTGFKYEEFEALLASYYLSLRPLKYTGSGDDLEDFREANEILNYFAKKYNLQRPKVAAENPRTKEEWAIPKPMSISLMLADLWQFIVSYGVGLKDEENFERNRLGRVILNVLDRYNVAEGVEYTEDNCRVMPYKFSSLDRKKESKTLDEIINKK